MIISFDVGAGGVRDQRLKVGVYKVTREVVRRLPRMDGGNIYRAYSFSRLNEEIENTLAENVEVKVLRPAIGWSRVRLPIELIMNPPDVYLGLSQSLPWNSPKNSIGFIYDLGFLKYPQLYPDSAEKLKRMTEETVQRARIIVTISDACKNEILKTYGIESEKVKVFYPGVDECFALAGEKHKEDTQYFLYVGSLKRQKNIPFLIRSFGRFLRSSKQKYKLLIVGGDYWRDPEIDKLIKSEKLSEAIELVGYVPDAELPKYYRGAIFFVSPSLVEGFCLPAVEAMACGCPVVASDLPVFREVVGEAGILVSPTNEREMALAMNRTADSDTLRSQMRAKGLERVKKYTWEGFVKGIFSLIS